MVQMHVTSQLKPARIAALSLIAILLGADIAGAVLLHRLWQARHGEGATLSTRIDGPRAALPLPALAIRANATL